MSDNRVAVYAKNVCFSYTKSNLILNNININVKTGHIYGLLGPSGCGKTTLLKCILGRLRPSGGQITIFDSKPGAPECQIPGAGVGYMPQELGLYMEFTIEEIVTYFGRIYSMERIDIKVKFTEISKLLNLPQNSKLIGNYSGGEKRRISLACALIHSPPLLILDEPTVGTDPRLRATILSHMSHLCSAGVTVILTTHYIEEARIANAVAFMRSGKILAEDNPNILLDKYSAITLEEVFLKLCESEDSINDKKGTTHTCDCHQNVIMNGIINSEIGSEPNSVSQRMSDTMNGSVYTLNKHMSEQAILQIEAKPKFTLKVNTFVGKSKALLQKNYTTVSRNMPQLILLILVPTIQMAIALYGIGEKPTNLNLAVFNEEQLLSTYTLGFGQLFIESIDNKTFNIIEFKSYASALSSTKSGHTYAMVYINDRFSEALNLRKFCWSEVDNQTLEESQVIVSIDWSNQLIAQHIELYLQRAMIEFTQKLAVMNDLNPQTVKMPLVFNQPISGRRTESFRDFAIPALLIILSYFATSIVGCNMVIMERRDGILERSLVAGITSSDFLFAHILTQLIILSFQLVLMIFIPPLLFDRQLTGSFLMIIIMLMSQGLCGIEYGLLVAALCDDVLFVCSFCFLKLIVSLMLGGVFWPFENQPHLLQYFSQLLPTTVPIRSLRDILYREWSITHYEVYMGFVVTYIWISIFFIMAFIFLRKSY